MDDGGSGDGDGEAGRCSSQFLLDSLADKHTSVHRQFIFVIYCQDESAQLI